MSKEEQENKLDGLMRQHAEMKRKHPDALLLFRVGDFYETYKDDAVKASDILGINTVNRTMSDGRNVQLAGFPHHALDTYLPKLVRAGMRVAICEQLENPKQKKIQKEEPMTFDKALSASMKEDGTVSIDRLGKLLQKDLLDVAFENKDKILYDPISDMFRTREDMLKWDPDGKIQMMNRWIKSEEDRIKGFPGYDGIEPYIELSKISVKALETHKATIKNENTDVSLNQPEMAKKKKEQAAQEEPSKTVKSSAEEKPAQENKTEAKAEQKAESQQERKPREPQMVTVNGEKVTHAHAYQSNVNKEDWYFTAKLDGKQLKPQKMDPADLAAYQKKEIGVPELMQRYYPTKLMAKVPESAYSMPNGIAGSEGVITVNKFNVYKEKDEQRPDFGRYKFYAEVGDQKMSAVASRNDLNSYFDRVATPGQLVEKNFGERLHLKSAYEGHRLPEGVDPAGIRIAKDRSDNKWKVSVNLGEHGQTSKKKISFDDGYSLFKAKTATREQIAAKYLNSEIAVKLAQPLAVKKEQGMKM